MVAGGVFEGLDNEFRGCYIWCMNNTMKKLEEVIASYPAGTIRWDGDELVGVAADGVVVNLGWRQAPQSAIDYLKYHPSPSAW